MRRVQQRVRWPLLLQRLKCPVLYRNVSFTAKKPLLGRVESKESDDVIGPARTRFAPSPTGFMHLGSLRTALYNYLLAKSTGGQFLLRLEDTDQKRLVDGAEQNIYQTLQWAGLNWDEGPIIGGPYGPYRQSDRTDIYRKYTDMLLETGKAYRCFCSRERLDTLTQSARQLYPPSLASYDRKCLISMSREESDERAARGDPFTIRLIAPDKYPVFHDILHGQQNLQIQVNYSDIRYDDPVLVKSDGLPTYHFANVIDDHLMKITHIIRGEEWLPSTPKHIFLYQAFGWDIPKFVHIPLLTTASDKKLSKRSGDASVLAMAQRDDILPEALVNFVALFGWSPDRKSQIGKSVNEIFNLEQLIDTFSLKGLTKGNAKVTDSKLHFFNGHFFREKLQNDLSFVNEIIDKLFENQLIEYLDPSFQSDITLDNRTSKQYAQSIIKVYQDSVSDISKLAEKMIIFYCSPKLPESPPKNFDKEITKDALKLISKTNNFSLENTTDICNQLMISRSKKAVFSNLRLALTGNLPSTSAPMVMYLLGRDVCQKRMQAVLNKYGGI